MNYIDEVAEKIFFFDNPEKAVFDEKPLYRQFALLALTKGRETTLKDVHDAWSVWALGNHMEWHWSVVPFDQLSPEVQEYDRSPMEAIHACSPSS